MLSSSMNGFIHACIIYPFLALLYSIVSGYLEGIVVSSGNFVTSRYEASAENGGGIYPCRIQPETLTATFGSTTNTAPAAAVDQFVSAKASKGKREYGVGMRAVTAVWDTPPAGYSGDPVRIVCLDPATYANWTVGATGNYLGANATIVSRLPENVR